MEAIDQPPPTLEVIFDKHEPEPIDGDFVDPTRWHILHVIANEDEDVLNYAVRHAAYTTVEPAAAGITPDAPAPIPTRGQRRTNVISRKYLQPGALGYRRARTEMLRQGADIRAITDNELEVMDLAGRIASDGITDVRGAPIEPPSAFIANYHGVVFKRHVSKYTGDVNQKAAGGRAEADGTNQSDSASADTTPHVLQSGKSPLRALSRWLGRGNAKTEQLLDPRAETVKRTINELTRARRIRAAVVLGFAATAITAAVSNGLYMSAENHQFTSEVSQIESQSEPSLNGIDEGPSGSAEDVQQHNVSYMRSAEKIPGDLALIGLIGGTLVSVVTIAWNEGEEKENQL